MIRIAHGGRDEKSDEPSVDWPTDAEGEDKKDGPLPNPLTGVEQRPLIGTIL